MKPHVCVPPPPRWVGFGMVPVVLLAAAVGCTPTQIRSQSEEETDRERYAVKSVGDVCSFGNAAPIHVTGAGLVEGLEGTGGPVPKCPAREAVENDLRKQRVEDVRAVMNSPNCAVVLVSALIPAGARKGDPIDVEVALPPGSKATSLRGGYLRKCVLFNYDFAGNLSKSYAGTNATLRGHPIARAEGPLLVGFGKDDDGGLTRGRIWDGGACLIARPFHMYMDAKHQSARVAAVVADRVNAAFQMAGGSGGEVASASNNQLVMLGVPAQYRLNLPRFLRVVRMIPLEETPAAKDEQRVPYPARLADDLLDPARTVTAALRLEALGAASIPALQKGLKEKHPLVRFCAAEALAYLGSRSCAEELAAVVRQQPYMRAYALTALASLDEAACQEKLRDLLHSDAGDDVRYGAFRALRARDASDPDVQGEQLNDAFALHHVARDGPPLVHVSLTRRAELVVFGPAPKFVPPLAIRAGEYAITAAEGDDRCTISYVPLYSAGEAGEASRVRCSLDAVEVVKAMATHGAGYPEVVEALRQADACRGLSCRVRTDALPSAASVQQLAEAGRDDRDERKRVADAVEIIKPDPEMGGTPTLYQATTGRRPGGFDRDARALQKPKPAAGPATAEQK